MNLTPAVKRLYSSFFFLFSTFLLLPVAASIRLSEASLLDLDSEAWDFLIPIFLALLVGIIIRLFTKPDEGSAQVNIRSGFLIVTTFWVLAAGIGCIPFFIGIKGISFTDAYFEAMSGFTTTGSTILPDVESLGPGLGLWRCMTQWLGGMGIIILFVAVLPSFGAGGYSLFRSEIPGGTIVERIKPRIAETAKSLWKVYLLLSLIECLLLWIVGMPFYDALCHTFTTMPTGGFSIKNQGIASYDSFLIELIIIIFMFIAGISFSLHYRLVHGENRYWENTEFKAYLFTLLAVSFFVFAMLLLHPSEDISIVDALRQAIFQVVSIGTTTGYATTDFNQWPVSPQLLLLALMFIGGCTGSTGGSIKVLRHVVAVKVVIRELCLVANPREVLSIKNGEKKIENEMLMNIFSFVILFFAFFALGTICLAITDMDMVSALSASAASIGNVGPGLGQVGPASTYAPLSPFAKWVLIILMLMGRLEMYTILAMAIPILQKFKDCRWEQ